MRRVLACCVLLVPATAWGQRPRAPEHELRTSGDLTVAPGERGLASLTVTPLPGRTLHPGAPLRVALTIEPAGGPLLPRRRLRRRDAADPRAEAPRFELPFTAPRTPGTWRLQAEVRFWLCARRTCWPVRDQAAISVTVASPAPAAPPPASSSAPPRPGAPLEATGAIP